MKHVEVASNSSEPSLRRKNALHTILHWWIFHEYNKSVNIGFSKRRFWFSSYLVIWDCCTANVQNIQGKADYTLSLWAEIQLLKAQVPSGLGMWWMATARMHCTFKYQNTMHDTKRRLLCSVLCLSNNSSHCRLQTKYKTDINSHSHPYAEGFQVNVFPFPKMLYTFFLLSNIVTPKQKLHFVLCI